MVISDCPHSGVNSFAETGCLPVVERTALLETKPEPQLDEQPEVPQHSTLSKAPLEVKSEPQLETLTEVQQSSTLSNAPLKSTSESQLGGLPEALQLSTLRKVPLSESELLAKVKYADVMLQMGVAKRIVVSDHEQAKALLEQARNKLAAAQQALTNHELAQADELVNQYYRTMAIATTLVPSPHQIQMAKSRHQQHIDGLQHAKELHQQAYQNRQAKLQLEYDTLQVLELEQQAEQLRKQEDYAHANQHLEQARMLVDLATMAMLHQQTVVYEVDVSTPEKEFDYEVGRFVSYEELIPVAIEMKRPNKMQLMLINRRISKGEWMAQQAKLTAEQNDYPKAIRMIMDASAEIRKALKLMKVKVYE